MIFSHESPEYVRTAKRMGANIHNGAYYYSKEILQHFIPNIETDRNWVTVSIPGNCWDHSIFFVHNNVSQKIYDWLSDYEDLVLVCGLPETQKRMSRLGLAVYLPLSIDVPYVEAFAREKDRDRAFFGRYAKAREQRFPIGTDVVCGLPRDELLSEMARYRQAYAVGRTAIEAKVLGCELLPYDRRFPDPSIWKAVDSREAASMLQGILDGIDG